MKTHCSCCRITVRPSVWVAVSCSSVPELQWCKYKPKVRLHPSRIQSRISLPVVMLAVCMCVCVCCAMFAFCLYIFVCLSICVYISVYLCTSVYQSVCLSRPSKSDRPRYEFWHRVTLLEVMVITVVGLCHGEWSQLIYKLMVYEIRVIGSMVVKHGNWRHGIEGHGRLDHRTWGHGFIVSKHMGFMINLLWYNGSWYCAVMVYTLMIRGVLLFGMMNTRLYHP